MHVNCIHPSCGECDMYKNVATTIFMRCNLLNLPLPTFGILFFYFVYATLYTLSKLAEQNIFIKKYLILVIYCGKEIRRESYKHLIVWLNASSERQTSHEGHWTIQQSENRLSYNSRTRNYFNNLFISFPKFVFHCNNGNAPSLQQSYYEEIDVYLSFSLFRYLPKLYKFVYLSVHHKVLAE